ncbi:MAG: histidinol-phosphatase [Pseudomonadota bacterium]|nr:histidinol-phosphatase [Pseudomonadota bacterium]
MIDKDFIKLAGSLADTASNVVMKYFRGSFRVDSKSDNSPVTIADKEAEVAMRSLIESLQPQHGIIGEEFESKNPKAEYVWVLDPIDGTQSFVTGKPVFGTLIALLHNQIPVLGLINIPALNERWVGAQGQPTTFNGEGVNVRNCEDISNAWLYATSPQMFKNSEFPAFENLRKASWRSVYGAECMAYGLLANGWVDIVCEGTMELHDYAPMVPIIEGAGGIISDWSGRPLGVDSDGTVLAAGNKKIHENALKILAHQAKS